MTRPPRYLQVAAELRQEIALGDVGPEGVLESEARLSHRFAISRVTVRKALAELQRDGLVVSRQGSGWYAAPALRSALGAFPTEVIAHQAAGGKIQRRTLDTRWMAPPVPIRELFALDLHERALRIRRVIAADGVPYDLVTTWLPPEVGTQTAAQELGGVGVWAVLQRLGVEPTRTQQTIGAALATSGEARLLAAAEPLALLLLRRVGYVDGHRAIAASDHRYPSARVRLSVTFPGAHPFDPLTDPPSPFDHANRGRGPDP